MRTEALQILAWRFLKVGLTSRIIGGSALVHLVEGLRELRLGEILRPSQSYDRLCRENYKARYS
jgi:hypothetical protein